MVFNERGESTESESEMVLANPEIVATSLERLIGEEGCLSFPQVYGKVERHAWIEVRYQSISGEVVQTKFTGT
jgi:peptide deformylase